MESFFYHRPLQWPLLAQNIYWVIVPLMPKPCPYKGDVARAKKQGTQRNFRNFVPSLPSRNLPSGQLLANNGRTEGNFLKQTWGPKIPHTSMGESILFSTLSTNIFFVYCKLCWRKTPAKKLKARNGPWARRISLGVSIYSETFIRMTWWLGHIFFGVGY